MGKKYVESQLKPGEQIVHTAKISAVAIFTGFIPGLIALTKSELAITNKQIIGKKVLSELSQFVRLWTKCRILPSAAVCSEKFSGIPISK